MVSRLRKPAEVRDALAGFADGKVDILIGTHRLLSRDVRAKDLGLVIVDEEQRFGVKQKELLRQLKLKVDVLSLSATPIPRTLQMSLAGLRDISVIETPPEGRRPVRTYVGPYDEELVARAIEREVAREGQAFFLHNRIDTLHEVAERLRALCPGVRFAEAHGQMDEAELEETMLTLPARRRRLPGGDDDHRVGARHPAGEHADRRARRPARARAGLPDPRPGRALSRARLRLHALPVRGGALGARRAPGWRRSPTTPSSAPASRSRCATSSSAAPATCSATSSPATSPRSASSSTCRCSTRRSRQLRAAGRRGAARPRRRCASTSTSTPTCPPTTSPSRRRRSTSTAGSPAPARPGELRALRDELRDRFGPLPEPVENLLALQRARIELGAAGARTAEVRGGRLSIVPLELDAATVGRAPRADPGGDLRAAHAGRCRCASATSPAERLEAVLALTEALSARARAPSRSRPEPRFLSLRFRCRSLCCRIRESAGKEGQAPPLPRGRRRRPRRSRARRSAWCCSARHARRAVRDRRRRAGHRRPERARRRDRGGRGRPRRDDHQGGVRPRPDPDRRPPGAQGGARRPTTRSTSCSPTPPSPT